MFQRLEGELKLTGYSGKTVQAYLFHNRQFLEFIKRTPEEIETDDVQTICLQRRTKSNLSRQAERPNSEDRLDLGATLQYKGAEILREKILSLVAGVQPKDV